MRNGFLSPLIWQVIWTLHEKNRLLNEIVFKTNSTQQVIEPWRIIRDDEIEIEKKVEW